MGNNYQYFDPIAYFQPRISAICSRANYDEYKVVAERNLASKDPSHEVVLAAMAGPTSRNTATVIYEVNVYTKDPNEAMSLLTELARANTERMFDSAVEDSDGNTNFYDIAPLYNTPTVLERNMKAGTDILCRVVQYVTFSVVANLLSVKSVKYLNEEVDFKSATISYSAETRPYPQSGQNLMKATPTGAAFTLSILMVPTNTPLVVLATKIMLGLEQKGTDIPLTITVGRDITVTKTFMLIGGTDPTVRGTLPSMQLSFMEKEE